MHTLCAIHLPTPPPPRLTTLATPHRRLGSLPRLPTRKNTAPPSARSAPTSSPPSATSSAAATSPPASSGFHCADCGHERLLAFTCKSRHLCPACHQRRVRQTADPIATAVCHEVPHRQFVFTIPKILRGIFRKRRDLLFKTATEIHLDDSRILVLEYT